MKKFKKVKSYSDSWIDECREFYPFFMRLKDELSHINSLSDRITHLKKSRKEIALEFSEKNKDFYESPLNLYFEARLDCLKDLLHFQDMLISNSSSMIWSGQKSDFIELVLSLKLSDVIELKDGSQITRKNLFRQFESFLGMEHINDLASRIHKLKSRSNTTPFLDELKKNCDRFLNDEE
jgi:hypothetical protein